MKLKGYNKYTFVKNPTKAQIKVVEKWLTMIMDIQNKNKTPSLRKKKEREYNNVKFWLGYNKI